MPKPKKTKIKLDSDSFVTLLQEIYNDIQIVQKIARDDIEARGKSLKLDTVHDVTQMGKMNNESLKIIDSSVEKKLVLAKLQAQVMNSDKPKDLETNKSGLGEDDKKLIRELIETNKKKNKTSFEI